MMEQKVREYLEHQREVMTQNRYLPLNIQFFADGGDAGGQGDGGDDGGSGDGAGDGSGSGDDGGTGDGAGNGDGSDGGNTNTFTQEDVNNIATKESRKAVEKVLKQLGVTDVKSAKEGLEQFKQMQQDQMTEQQKIEARAKDLEAANNTYATQVNDLQAQLAALKADVNPDSVADVVVLANNLVSDEVTIEDAMKQVVEKYPHFKRQVETNNDDDQDDKQTKKPPKFTQGNHNADKKQTQEEAWANAFKF